MAAQHVRDWPGIPIAVACADPRGRKALRADSLGRRLIVTASLFSAITSVLANPALAFQRLTLAAHPTAPRASREFVTRTLHHWQLGTVIPLASLVVGELVASSSINASNNIDLPVSWNRGALRLTVRDHSPAPAGSAAPAPRPVQAGSDRPRRRFTGIRSMSFYQQRGEQLQSRAANQLHAVQP